MRVDDEPRGPQMRARRLAEPAHDRHPAVVAVHVHERLAAQVVIEMDLVPGLPEPGQAIRRRPDPDGVGMGGQERGRSPVVVVEEEDPPALSRSPQSVAWEEASSRGLGTFLAGAWRYSGTISRSMAITAGAGPSTR